MGNAYGCTCMCSLGRGNRRGKAEEDAAVMGIPSIMCLKKRASGWPTTEDGIHRQAVWVFLLINLKHTLRYSLHSNLAGLEHSLTTACSSNTATCSGKQRFIMSLLLFGQANKCQICIVQVDGLLNGAFPWQVEDLSSRELKPYSSNLSEHLKHSTHFIFRSLKVSRPGSD